MTLGEKILDLRKRKGISQEKLAELLDISRQAVTKWESGKGNPDTENLIRLSEIFGHRRHRLGRQNDHQADDPRRAVRIPSDHAEKKRKSRRQKSTRADIFFVLSRFLL